MSYTKSIESKWIRATHKITFNTGHSVESLKQALAYIPSSLSITEIDCNEETGEITLEFLQENQLRQP